MKLPSAGTGNGRGQHRIFSHFLSEASRREADLDGDRIVSLAELIQYLAAGVPRQAEAVIEDAKSCGESAPPRRTKHPLVMWNGPIQVPIVRYRPEQRAGFP